MIDGDPPSSLVDRDSFISGRSSSATVDSVLTALDPEIFGRLARKEVNPGPDAPTVREPHACPSAKEETPPRLDGVELLDCIDPRDLLVRPGCEVDLAADEVAPGR